VILSLTLLGAGVVVAVATWWQARSPDGERTPPGRDPDWGDWPSDQMAP
jgi:hypothetical protein